MRAAPRLQPSDRLPECDKCGAPVTTGAMAMLCPFGRACAFVEDDDHWQVIEEFRQDFAIERAGKATS